MQARQDTNPNAPAPPPPDEQARPKFVRRIFPADERLPPLGVALKYAVLGILIVIAWLLLWLVLRNSI